MIIDLDDGRQLTLPDNSSEQEIMAAARRAYLPTPSTAGWMVGAVQAGSADLTRKAVNLAELFGADQGWVASNRARLEKARQLPLMQAYEEHFQDLPWYGKLGLGVLEFAPQLPLYEAFGGAALGAVARLPKIGAVAKWLASPSGRAIPDYARAVGKAGVTGTVVGGIAGVPAGAPLSERGMEAVREGAGFAGAVGVLHPVMKGIGYALGRGRRLRLKKEADAKITPELIKAAETDPAERARLDALRSIAGADRGPVKVEDPIVIEPEEELIEGPSINKREAKRLAKLGYSVEDFAGRPKAEVVNILKKGIKKPAELTPEEEAGGFYGEAEPPTQVERRGATEKAAFIRKRFDELSSEMGVVGRYPSGEESAKIIEKAEEEWEASTSGQNLVEAAPMTGWYDFLRGKGYKVPDNIEVGAKNAEAINGRLRRLNRGKDMDLRALDEEWQSLTQREIEAYDQKNQPGLQGGVGGREEPISGEPKPRAGEGEVEAGGVLQAPGAPEGKGKAEAQEGVTQPTSDQILVEAAKSKGGRPPKWHPSADQVKALQMMGYRGSDIKKMDKAAFDSIVKEYGVEDTPEQVAKAEIVRKHLEAMIEEKRSADMNFLTERGYDRPTLEDQWSDAEIARKAMELREKGVPPLLAKQEEADALIAKLEAVQDAGEFEDLARLTEEEKAAVLGQYDADLETVYKEVLAINEPEVTEALEQARRDIVAGPMPLSERIKKRMLAISPESVEVTKGKRRRARGKAKEQKEEPPEIITEAEIESISAEAKEELGVRVEPKSAEDWEALLAEEGMPAELEFEERWRGQRGSVDISFLKPIADRIRMLADNSRKIQQESGPRIIAELAGEEGTTKIYAKNTRDIVSPFADWIGTTAGWADKHPMSEDIVFSLRKNISKMSHLQQEHITSLRAIENTLSTAERDMSGLVMRGKATSTAALDRAIPKIREWLDVMKEKEKQYQRSMIMSHLSEGERNAVLDLISGEAPDLVYAKYKTRINPKTGRRVKYIDPTVVKEIWDNYKAIDNWGIDDYVSNHERGRFKIMAMMEGEDGKQHRTLVAVGLSIKDATRKALRYAETHPGTEELFIDTEMAKFDEFATGLSKKQYWALTNDLAKALKEKVDGLEKMVNAKAAAIKGMKGKFVVQPTDTFTPYTKPRHDILQGEDNIFPVLRHYAYSMEKRWALEPIIDRVRREVWNIPSKQIQHNLINLIEDVKGRYWEEDKAADWILRGITGFSNRVFNTDFDTPRPMAFSRFVGGSKAVEAHMKLMYRPVAAIVNLASGQGHTYVKMGAEYYGKAWQLYRTPEGKKLLEDLRPFLGQTFIDEATGQVISQGVLQKLGLIKMGKSPWVNEIKEMAEPLGMFQAAEVPNRDAASLAAYIMGKEKFGLSEEAARDFAIKQCWFTQFTYDMATLPRAMRRPLGRLLLQFKPYLLQELRFIKSLRGAEIARYAAVQAALAGPRGMMYAIRTIPLISLLVPAATWDKIEEYANTYLPRASRGVGGALGVDVTGPATFQFPTQGSDWLGPMASDMLEASKLWQRFISPEEMGAGDLGKLIGSSVPFLKYWGRAIDQAVDADGWVKDERGRNLYHIDNLPIYVAKNVAGAEDLAMSQIRTAERIDRARRGTIADNKQAAIDRAVKEISSGEPLSSKTLEMLTRYGVKPASLRRAMLYRSMDAKTRRLLMTEVMRRPEIQEMYPEVGY